ncbi:MAG: type II secretion system F family protein [Pirellulales bacterium]|nr:type II secretion system F family protein [Pirellulales bacterium]
MIDSFLLIAGLPPGAGWMIAACLFMGAAVGLTSWWVIRVLQTEDLEQGAEWRYDVSRINDLRRLDFFYRLFQPLLQPFALLNRKFFRNAMPVMQREIQAAGLPRCWLPEEYLAKAELIAIFSIPLWYYAFYKIFDSQGLILIPLFVVLTAWYLRRRLSAQARMRLHQIKRRMPFLLDLLTLLMEAGSTFIGAMRQAVEEFHGHPVAQEFGRVLADMNMGKTRVEAFQAMRDRLNDDEITSIISSILQGENLGTPLANIFRTQADVLRIKRTQRAELLAGEAGVNMLLPGVLIMAATVIIIIGPFFLNYLKFGLSL